MTLNSKVSTNREQLVLTSKLFYSFRPMIEAAVNIMSASTKQRRLYQKLISSELTPDEAEPEEQDQSSLCSGGKRGRKPKMISYGGQTMTISEWSKTMGLSYGTVIRRVKEGQAIGAPRGRVGRKPKVKSTDPAAASVSFEGGDSSGLKNSSLNSDSSMPLAAKEQIITWRGETRTLNQWSELSGINVATILARLDRGWSEHRVLSEPPMARGRGKQNYEKSRQKHEEFIANISGHGGRKVIIRRKNNDSENVMNN